MLLFGFYIYTVMMLSASVAGLSSYYIEKFGGDALLTQRYHSAGRQRPVAEQLLPVDSEALAGENAAQSSRPYIYEPDAASIFATMLPMHLLATLQDAFAENRASEQAARVMAMQAASDNARKLLEQLQLEYNKLRQQSITTELLDGKRFGVHRQQLLGHRALAPCAVVAHVGEVHAVYLSIQKTLHEPLKHVFDGIAVGLAVHTFRLQNLDAAFSPEACGGFEHLGAYGINLHLKTFADGCAQAGHVRLHEFKEVGVVCPAQPVVAAESNNCQTSHLF